MTLVKRLWSVEEFQHRFLLPHFLQNDIKTLKKWMADVDVFLNEEWPALGDSEALEKQLEQCTVRKPFILTLLQTKQSLSLALFKLRLHHMLNV